MRWLAFRYPDGAGATRAWAGSHDAATAWCRNCGYEFVGLRSHSEQASALLSPPTPEQQEEALMGALVMSVALGRRVA